MKKLAIVSLAFAFGIFGITVHAYADTVSATNPTTSDVTISVPVDTTVSTPVDPIQDLISQITLLKLENKDPAVGFWTKFLNGLKIRNLENKLNLQKALQ
jgi:hypothetical protein